MYVNKIGKSDSADLFFEIMSKFNDRDKCEPINIEKIAAGGVKYTLENLGFLGKAMDASLAIAKRSGGVSDEIAEALSRGVAASADKRAHGVWHLLKGADQAAKNASQEIVEASLGRAVGQMLESPKGVGHFMNSAGEFTEAGREALHAAARQGGTVSPEAADELVKALAGGQAYVKGFTGYKVNQSLARAHNKATRAAKETTEAGVDAAPAAARADDFGTGAAGKANAEAAAAAEGGIEKGWRAVEDPATGKWSIKQDVNFIHGADAVATGAAAELKAARNIKLTADEIAAAILDGAQEQLKAVQSALRGGKTGWKKGVEGTAEEVLERTIKSLDEAEAAAKKIVHEGVREKTLYYLQSLRKVANNQAKSAKNVGQTVNNSHQVFINTGSGNQIINQGFGDAAENLFRSVDSSLTKANQQLGQVLVAKQGLNRLGSQINQTAGDVTVNVGRGMGDDAVRGMEDVFNIHMKNNAKAFQEFSNTMVNNQKQVIEELTELKRIAEAGGPGAAAAARKHDDFIKIFQKMDMSNVGNANFMKALKEAGIDVPLTWSQRAGKWAKVAAWGVGLGALGYAAMLGYGYGKDKGWWGSGSGGSGGSGSGLPPETIGEPRISDPYTGVTDPEAKESLALVDPNSAKYNPRTGWVASNKTIKRLKESGDVAVLEAYKRALLTAYDKSYAMELKPPFVVSGTSTPLYYAYVNQHMAPAPNLADRITRNTKFMVANDGLQDPEGEGPAEVFYVMREMFSGDAQASINYTAEQTIAKGLAERGGWFFGLGNSRHRGRSRSEDFLMGEDLDRDTDSGIAGHRARPMSKADRYIVNKIRERRASEGRLDSFKKFAELSSRDNAERLINLECFANITNDSTNITKSTDNQTLEKKADDFSKSYYKDAVTDLNNTDKILQSYFAGLGGLYDQRLEKRKADFKTLYNVTDETGEDLIYEAHPKEVVVSDSIGRGGLVENGLEQKRQTHGVALSAPTGNYRANYASRHDDLKKLSKLSFSS